MSDRGGRRRSGALRSFVVGGMVGAAAAAGAHNENLVVFRGGLCSARTEAICHPANADLGACVQQFNCWEHDTGRATPGCSD